MDNAVVLKKIKENLINLALLLLAVFIAFKIYQSKEPEISSLKSRKTTEEQKNKVLGDISIREKEFDFLKEHVNNKEMSTLLDKIGDFAKATSVQIIKITPQTPVVSGGYTKYAYDMSLSAEDYHRIGIFVSSLENAPEILMVENLNMSKDQNIKPAKVDATLTVSTILINK